MKKKENTGYSLTIPQQFNFPTHRELLKFMREHAGLTQGKLARKIKTKQSAIARLEKSRRHPSLLTLHKIAKACGFNMGAPAFACNKCSKEISNCTCKRK